eukprot:1855529-Pleurochrysis_carterae.AAC.3
MLVKLVRRHEADGLLVEHAVARRARACALLVGREQKQARAPLVRAQREAGSSQFTGGGRDERTCFFKRHVDAVVQITGPKDAVKEVTRARHSARLGANGVARNVVAGRHIRRRVRRACSSGCRRWRFDACSRPRVTQRVATSKHASARENAHLACLQARFVGRAEAVANAEAAARVRLGGCARQTDHPARRSERHRDRDAIRLQPRLERSETVGYTEPFGEEAVDVLELRVADRERLRVRREVGADEEEGGATYLAADGDGALVGEQPAEHGPTREKRKVRAAERVCRYQGVLRSRAAAAAAAAAAIAAAVATAFAGAVAAALITLAASASPAAAYRIVSPASPASRAVCVVPKRTATDRMTSVSTPTVAFVIDLEGGTQRSLPFRLARQEDRCADRPLRFLRRHRIHVVLAHA